MCAKPAGRLGSLGPDHGGSNAGAAINRVTPADLEAPTQEWLPTEFRLPAGPGPAQTRDWIKFVSLHQSHGADHSASHQPTGRTPDINP